MTKYTKPVRLATAAFHAALADKQDAAARYLQRISDECGGEGLNVALRAWIDTYADHATDGRPGRSSTRMAFIQENTGQLDREDSERVPAEIRWAGQLIAARCAMDQDRFSQLIDDMPRDGNEIARYVFAVLAACARTVNGLPRGFARMGAYRETTESDES